jgi:hypothetical protein
MFPRERNNRDSIQKIPQFDEPFHRKPWNGYDFSRGGRRCRHPDRQYVRCPACRPDKHMGCAKILILAQNDKALSS